MAHAVSPDLVDGVDCRLPTASGARSRAVGTTSAHGVITGGRVLQGSVQVRLERGELDRRRPWSHYLAKPGTVETIGRFHPADVAEGFFAEPLPAAALDLGAIGDRLIANVQLNRRLDHAIPFRSKRTRMRWTATVGNDEGSRYGEEFTIENDTLRTFNLTLGEDNLSAAAGFCEDLALHDWVLTTLLELVDRSNLDSATGPAAIAGLRPAIDHLLHLWMPGAHVAHSLLPLWERLERRAGFTRQWQATVTRIRDQLALRTLIALGSPTPPRKQ